ncbi:MAG: Zn-dependent exopeptidase M28 [Chloroflexota bacterium]|nr:Zn-dependent exopeptidase M28 [Chloroflexota bacterium]
MHLKQRFAALFFLVVLILLGTFNGDSGLASHVVSQRASQQTQAQLVQSVVGQVSNDELLDLVKRLSGALPAVVGGKEVTFQTRYTPSEHGTLSEQYVYEYFQALGLVSSYHAWSGGPFGCATINGRNVIGEIPGSKEPGRIYIFGGHLDSTAPDTMKAPGADDNASGTSALMLAARIFSKYRPDYTVRFVAFTGEESGLCGSRRYASEASARGEDIRGVINADMIAYDGNGVRDVEIHAGVRPDSQAIADLLVSNIDTLNLDLVPNVYTSDSTDRSDHASFWANNYPAVTVAENVFNGDPNPYYHSVICCDTWDHMDLEMAADLTRAIVASLATMTGMQPLPTPTPVPVEPVPGTGSYKFPETGKTVTGIFLDYWNRNGGLAQIGYPISEVMGEVSELNGEPYTVQYFERAVLEYHPENQPPYNVLLSQLGTYQYKKKYPNGAPNQQASSVGQVVRFPETGKAVGGKFVEYWRSHGGVALQGFPISEEFTEVSPLNGKTYLVQYFERAVMEYHPENQPPYDVLLSQLGTYQYKQKYNGR